MIQKRQLIEQLCNSRRQICRLGPQNQSQPRADLIAYRAAVIGIQLSELNIGGATWHDRSLRFPLR